MRFSRLTRNGRSRAAAIMLALWALFVLSAVIISWALDINTRLTLSGASNHVLEAEAMACSGSEVAMHPAVKPGMAVLHGSFGSQQSYEARITGEAGRLNLARLLIGENPVNLELLRHYLEVRGVDINERDAMIDSLLDWVDPDNLVRMNGAEDDEGYKAANQPLKTIEELKRVRGWEEFTSRPNWDEDFTVMPGLQTAQIDVNSAPRNVLLALPGLTEGLVDRFMAMRRGPDDIEGTEDDVHFDDLQRVQIALGLGPDQFRQIAGLITTTSPVVRIVSVGKSGNITRTVRLVMFKQNNAMRLFSWKEY